MTVPGLRPAYASKPGDRAVMAALFVPYRWRPGDAERDAEVAAQLAAIRHQARKNRQEEIERERAVPL